MDSGETQRDAEPPPQHPQPVDALPSMTLLARVQGGDAVARDELVRRYWPRLERWARGRLPAGARDLHDTADLVQETMVNALRRLDQFQPEHDGALQAYLRTAILNRIRTLAKRASTRAERIEMDSGVHDRTPSPLEQAIGRDALGRYERALVRLRPDDRHAIHLKVELDLPYPEIARELGKPTLTAARMAVSRALARLAREMRDG
jgi:RNA polymerase sigma-70 factor (ECF subfamily)